MHICEDISSVAHICEGIKVLVFCFFCFFARCTKTFAGPQTKSFFGREHFETTVCAPYDSVALEFGTCGHLNDPPAAQICPSVKCVALLEVNWYLICLSDEDHLLQISTVQSNTVPIYHMSTE